MVMTNLSIWLKSAMQDRSHFFSFVILEGFKILYKNGKLT